MEDNIVDGFEGIKLVLWQNYIDQVEINRTYVFENVRIKKNNKNKDIYINTAKGNQTKIQSCEEFTDSLAIPQEAYTQVIEDAELIAVEDISTYLSCMKCSKKLKTTLLLLIVVTVT